MRQVHIGKLQYLPGRIVDGTVRVQLHQCLRVRLVTAFTRGEIGHVRVDLFDFAPVDLHRYRTENNASRYYDANDENGRDDHDDGGFFGQLLFRFHFSPPVYNKVLQ